MKNKLFILIAVIAVAGVLFCVYFCGNGINEKTTDDGATSVDESDGRTEVATRAEESEALETSAVFLSTAASDFSEASSDLSMKVTKDVDKVMCMMKGLASSGKTVLSERRGKSKAKVSASRGVMKLMASKETAVSDGFDLSKSVVVRDEVSKFKRRTEESNNRTSGLLTAGEWNDLENWKFWADLLNDNEFYSKTDYWLFYPKNLVAVQIVDKNSVGIANISVELLKGDSLEFATKTDNAGYAYCWINLFGGEDKEIKTDEFSLKINGERFKGPFKLTTKVDEKLNVNVIFKNDIKQPKANADVAFIVDATGSMKDEIRFLKSDLSYIIDHASSESKVALRTAALFYRDVGDVYLTRFKDFSNDASKTQKYVSEQDAHGGGDYPEAVHSALEASLQNLSWNESARSRIAFLILDAPAHHEEEIIRSLQNSIKLYAKHGIKLIPVAASGVDKDAEFMLRFFDLATGGTYVFLTDDSGIGNSHIKASVGDHKVEKLADIMVRLIKKYVK